MKSFRILTGLAVLFGLALSSPSRAASLTGDSINGALTFCSLAGSGNNFTPTSVFAPGEFDFADGANIDSAVFSDSTLTVTDQVLDVACGWGMTFTDTTTPFSTLILLGSTFSPDLTFDVTDGVISLQWDGSGDQQTYTAVFSVEPAPEPASMTLFGFGLAGIGLIRQRRRGGAAA